MDHALIEKLNAGNAQDRLNTLRELAPTYSFPEKDPFYVNNHIHTTYSFSPYSPTAAVFEARAEGLCTAGIVDHDTMAGAQEFLDAAKILELPVTVGMECRVSFAGTPFAGRRLNNPDQIGIGYMTIQSVPHHRIEEMTSFFAPYRAERDKRNQRMIDNLNALLSEFALDYRTDVLPLSMQKEGGVVTERHLLYALAGKLEKIYPQPEELLKGVQALGVDLSEKQRAQLADPANPFRTYDLLGMLKSAFLPRIYVDADAECPSLPEIVRKAEEVGGILCYAYLGDVGESVTGDKKTQAFEDAILEDLMAYLQNEGVRAVTYMPTRNTREQLVRLRALCDRYGMFQVSGEDVNSPRQSFVIEAMKDPLFRNLIEATWKLIEREKEEES